MKNKKNSAYEKVEKIVSEKSTENKKETLLEKEQKLLEKEKKAGNKNGYSETIRNETMVDGTHKKPKKNKKLLGVITFLSFLSFMLASALTLSFILPRESDKLLNAEYTQSFYNTIEQVENIDLNLSKALATKDKSSFQGYLMDTAINSEVCESSLRQLPLKDENKFYTTKLINQIGDFSKYLSKKVSEEKSASDEDITILFQLYSSNKNLKEMLIKTLNNMGDDFSFYNMDEGSIVVKNFNELENMSINYPELIYDGPFSDGINNREIKGLLGDEISKDTAKEIFAGIFSGHSISGIQEMGETTGEIDCFNFQGSVGDETLYGQISKRGGKLIMFAYSGSCNAVNYGQDSAIEKAKEFLDYIGVLDMDAVWVNLSNNVYTINFAYTVNDIVIYSDLVKVRVCAETGQIIGAEASSYYINHTEREIGSPSISVLEAKNKVSSNIDIESARLVVIPIGTRSETLCYEIYGEYDGSQYYVYIDAITGKQQEMFKVIKSSEGTLLM